MSEHHEEYEKTRICLNPDCELKGIPQPTENFYRYGKNNRIRRLECKSCILRKRHAWIEKNRDEIREYYKIPGDDDPETDLVPMEAGGFVRWAVLTDERRKAHGEQSPFNGLSVARDRAME